MPVHDQIILADPADLPRGVAVKAPDGSVTLFLDLPR
jgi:hypothetical protein